MASLKSDGRGGRLKSAGCDGRIAGLGAYALFGVGGRSGSDKPRHLHSQIEKDKTYSRNNGPEVEPDVELFVQRSSMECLTADKSLDNGVLDSR